MEDEDGIPYEHLVIHGISKTLVKQSVSLMSILWVESTKMTLQEFNGDFTKMHVILRFRVDECVGQDALTTFIGHHHQTDHTRRQIEDIAVKLTT